MAINGTSLPSKFYHLSASSNGDVWLLDHNDYQDYAHSDRHYRLYYRPQGGTWQRFEEFALLTAALPNGNVALAHSHFGGRTDVKLFNAKTGKSEELEGEEDRQIFDIAASRNGHIWAVDKNTWTTFRWNGKDWKGGPSGASLLAVTKDDRPWVVRRQAIGDLMGGLFEWSGTKWIDHNTLATDIDISNSDAVWACRSILGKMIASRYYQGKWVDVAEVPHGINVTAMSDNEAIIKKLDLSWVAVSI